MATHHDFPLIASSLLLHTRDLDESRLVTSRMWEKHRVEMTGRGLFETRVHGMQSDETGVSFVDCRSSLLIDLEPVRDQYYLHVPVEGEVGFRVNGKEAVSSTGTGVLCGPGQSIRMMASPVKSLVFSWNADFLGRALGGDAWKCPTALETWALSVDFATAAGARLKAACLGFASRPESKPGSKEFVAYSTTQADALVRYLNEVNPFPASPSDPWIGQTRLGDLAEWIRARVADPIGLVDVVAKSGVSARAIQKAFRKHFGVGPTRFITELKLDEARRRIMANPRVPLAELATSLGFPHYGRFAAGYSRRFGESPGVAKNRWGS